jgi:hypothetical protein
MPHGSDGLLVGEVDGLRLVRVGGEHTALTHQETGDEERSLHNVSTPLSRVLKATQFRLTQQDFPGR